MSKFIIRAVKGSVDDSLRVRLREAPTVSVLEDTARMLLVEADSESDLRSAADLSGMLIFPERHVEPPATRPKLR